MNTGLALSLISAFWALPCLASTEQVVFFHLHQAYELMELDKRGKCSTAVSLITPHLETAQQALRNEPFSPFYPHLKKLIQLKDSLPTARLSDIEKVRLQVHSTAGQMGLKHRQRWHQELDQCKSPTH